MTINLIQGNCLDKLKELKSKSINCCITSPPYYALRDYNMDEQIGLEDTYQEYIENLVKVFKEVKRLLKDDGTLWLNMGDTYVGTGQKTKDSYLDKKYKNGRSSKKKPLNNRVEGLKRKDLMGMPWRIAFALQNDGWYLRQDIIWYKTNPMPESVTDRCTKSHEYIFLLSKSVNYYFDNEAIKEKSTFKNSKGEYRANSMKNIKKHEEHDGFDIRNGLSKMKEQPYKNKRSVWKVNTVPFKDAHFATFPPKLIEPMILAGCPEKICVDCNTPYVRQVESKRFKRNELPKDDPRYRPNTYEGSYKDINGKADAGYTETKDLGLQKQCDCETNETKAGTVLDPFGGAGTTALVADRLNRNAVSIELNEDYIEITKKRLEKDNSLFLKLSD
tara:strand:- start:48 stop:1211 length:1164 start_codon:yes stop_codon:yes gene_type:complete